VRATCLRAVCGQAGDVIDRLGSLVDWSLMRSIEGVSGRSRFTMLETILEYARGQLAASAEDEQLHSQHAAYFVGLAERGEPALRTRDRSVWRPARS
jgi:predicted ATPase